MFLFFEGDVRGNTITSITNFLPEELTLFIIKLWWVFVKLCITSLRVAYKYLPSREIAKYTLRKYWNHYGLVLSYLIHFTLFWHNIQNWRGSLTQTHVFILLSFLHFVFDVFISDHNTIRLAINYRKRKPKEQKTPTHED